MKKSIFPFILVGMLAVGCSEEKGSQSEEPDAPGTETKLYKDVEPLEPLGNWAPDAGEKADLQALSDFSYRLNTQAIDSYASLWGKGKGPKGNYSLSPLSVSVFISALSQSVDGDGRKDLCDMLGVKDERIATLNNTLLRYLSKNEIGVETSLANSVWHTGKFPLLDAYKTKMADLFGAPVNELDLYSDESADVINAWCSDKTHGMIKKLFTEAPNSDIVIANALYLSADWIFPFSQDKTTREIFQGTAGDVEVDMMSAKETPASYFRDETCEAVTRRMMGNFDLKIIVPAEGSDPEAFGKSLAETMKKIDNGSVSRKVNLSLPKFADSQSVEIKDLLISVGFPDYNLTTLCMTGNEACVLDHDRISIKHATSLNVTEKGLEMAAVTAGSLGFGNLDDITEVVTMRVDRPFYYIVRDSETGIVLMIGRVCNL